MQELSQASFTPYILPKEVADRRFAQWCQAMELSHEMLMAGLRHQIGPEGDLAQAYRGWYHRRHDRKWQEIMEVQERRKREANHLNSSNTR